MNPSVFRRFAPAFLGVLLLVLNVFRLDAAVFSVADGDVVGLKNAIIAANSNGEDDTIELAFNGTYAVDSIDNDVNGLPVIAADDGRKVIINGNNALIQRSTADGTPLFRILEVGPGADVRLGQLTINNGYAPGEASEDGFPQNVGGGIYNDHAALALSNCVLSNNSANSGGGIYSDGRSGVATLMVSNTTLNGNSAGAGAGILNSGVFGGNATLTVIDCDFSSNAATDSGAAIFNSATSGNATLIVKKSKFSGNSVDPDGRGGGAIYNFGWSGNAMATVSDSTFSDNSALADGGGAIYNDGSSGSATLQLSKSAISGNSSDSGAGIFNNGSSGSATLTVSDSTLTGNSAGSSGGAILNTGSGWTNASLTVSRSTLSGNSAMDGGGIANFNDGDVVMIESTVLQAGTSGENIYNSSGLISSKGFNLSSDGGGGYLIATGDQINTDPKLDPNGLQNNGGPTQTIALLADSPAINNGDPNAPGQDQRYYLRNGVPDIGAFEFNGTIGPMTAISRKAHGSAGTFDVNLPLTGTLGIECRTGGATNDYQIVLTFPANVGVTGAPQAQVTTGTGAIGSGGVFNGGAVTVSNNVVTIPLTNVANGQRMQITLFGVQDSFTTSDVIIPMNVLQGDTTANGVVNSSDIAQTQSQSGQTVTSSNFREDVTVNGSINSSDIAFVQSKSGTGLPVTTAQIKSKSSRKIRPPASASNN